MALTASAPAEPATGSLDAALEPPRPLAPRDHQADVLDAGSGSQEASESLSDDDIKRDALIAKFDRWAQQAPINKLRKAVVMIVDGIEHIDDYRGAGKAA